MNKIYIGDLEINTGGSGGGSEFNPSDYVDASTWNDHEKVIASALFNLKGLENQIEAFDADIQAQETALLAEVHVVEQQKADASTVYTKNNIDKSDKVVAAALASLNERVSTLETSSGGSGESGDSVSLTDYVFVDTDGTDNVLKITQGTGSAQLLNQLKILGLKTTSLMCYSDFTDDFVFFENGQMYVNQNSTVYQIDLTALVNNYGTPVNVEQLS